MNALTRLQELFRTLFQYDLSDLDFGIYRLLRLKRDEVDAFLTEQLPHTVSEAFQIEAGEDRERLEQRVEALTAQIQQDIAGDALDDDGAVKPEYAAMNARAVRVLVKEYEQARSALAAARASADATEEVFNHLYAFFSRYCEDGDFISRRFYGQPERYAVPYNGEETLFTWANRDQHYVKSGERFRDYAFRVSTVMGEYRVRFQLAEASTTPGNGKGETRFFFPLPDQIEWDEAQQILTIPFQYRVPTGEESKTDSNTADAKKLRGQDAILSEAEPLVRAAIKDDSLAAALGQPANGNGAEITVLLKRMRHFARRNISDFFIHKDLRGFLERELEFYLKDQFLRLDDMYGNIGARLRTLRVLRRIATDVIAFLAQIEDFQKRIFEKRKFVLRTDYLLRINRVPRSFWPAVLANEAQLEEWKRLFAIEPSPTLLNPTGRINEFFLEEHPGLVVDTALYGDKFKFALLEEVHDIDEESDGLLVHSENYQALRFLAPYYAQRMSCVYIDPPYNTDATEIIYKNGYKESSWIALIAPRLNLGRSMLRPDGVNCLTIDDYEHPLARLLLDEQFGHENYLATALIRNNPSGRSTVKGFSVNHEFALFYGVQEGTRVGRLPHSEKQKGRYDAQDESGAFEWENFRKSSAGSDRASRPKQHYPFYVRDGALTMRIPEIRWLEGAKRYEINEDPASDEAVVWPLDESGAQKVWRWGIERARAELHTLCARAAGGRFEIYGRKYLNQAGVLPRTWWDKPDYSARDNGTRVLRDMFSSQVPFDFPKAVEAVKDSILIGCESDDGMVLDYFAGSGTTAHAVIALNRESGAQRRFALVELGLHFDGVLVPRIKKVMYSPEWKDGKPKRPASEEEVERGPRLVKILRLESYEDALHNLTTEEELARQQKRSSAARTAVGPDRFRLHYLLRLPFEAGDTLLNTGKLEHPFRYTLETLTDDGPRVENVDLVETFNYLAGLQVHQFRLWNNDADGSREYRVIFATNRENERVCVVWRDMDGLDPERERAFLAPRLREAGAFDTIWINGDSAVPGVRSLDGEFARLMEEEEEA